MKKSADAQQKSEKALNEQAKSLLASAKLNALAAIDKMYSERVASGELNLAVRRGDINNQMEEILNELNDQH